MKKENIGQTVYKKLQEMLNNVDRTEETNKAIREIVCK